MVSSVSVTSVDAVYGSTRAKPTGSREPTEGGDSGSLNVLISSRLERLSKLVGSTTGQVSDAGVYDSQRNSAPDSFGASELRYSPSAEGGQADYGKNVDTVGGAFDTMDRVESALRQMGREAVLAQANQQPRGAMP